MISQLVKFPIWEDDKEAIVPINILQRKQINNFSNKVMNNEYKFVKNTCLCGNTDQDLDILVAEKDRYGISCDNVLCRKCGLIRLKERLDDHSTEEFYKNEYRDIYVGVETASDNFFDAQVQRGKEFLNLVQKYVDIKDINNVFEIGCGAGGIVYPFKIISDNVSGCDFGAKYLKYGRGKGLNLYQGEINENNTPKESQDLIILSHVMEHFVNPLDTMNSIIEFIKPERYLLVEVPGIFNIPKTYFNPILYFQNAHVHNYYYYYLKVFFKTLGLEVIYGDERCTFLLKKPIDWKKKKDLIVYTSELSDWAVTVEKSLKKYHFQHLLKLNSYYYKIGIIKLLDLLGLKEIIKKLLGK